MARAKDFFYFRAVFSRHSIKLRTAETAYCFGLVVDFHHRTSLELAFDFYDAARQQALAIADCDKCASSIHMVPAAVPLSIQRIFC